MNEDHVYENAENPPSAENDAATTAQTEERMPLTPTEAQATSATDEGDQLSTDPDADSDPHPDSAAPSGAKAGIDELRCELNRLKAALAMREQRHARIDREYAEFQALYPDVPLNSLPDALWEEVEHGVPLAAAFALAERKRMRSEALAQSENRKNQERSSGALNASPDGELSPAEVRAMSPSDVKKNFSRIMRSIQKWH